MPRKTRPDKPENAAPADGPPTVKSAPRARSPRLTSPCDALDFKNITLLRQFVTDQGRILPRKYTGLPAHYQRRLNRAIKRARQMLLMK